MNSWSLNYEYAVRQNQSTEYAAYLRFLVFGENFENTSLLVINFACLNLSVVYLIGQVYTGDIDMERQYPLIEMEVIDYVMMKLLVRAGEMEEDEAVGIDLDMTMAVQDGNGSQVLGVNPSCLFVLNYTNGAEVNGHGSFMMEEEQGKNMLAP